MTVHFGLAGLAPDWPGSTVCIGVFDGVHLGHQRLIRSAVEAGRAEESPAVLVTFDRHPLTVLAPHAAPVQLAGLGQNLRQFAELGVAMTIVLPFDSSLAATRAQDFLDTVLLSGLRAKRLVVGHDFALGRHREGTADWLAARIPTEVVPPFEVDGHRVSSTLVRKAVAEGRVDDAARWLGRPFEVEGAVVAGQKLGRQLGFPTANLSLSERLAIPADGVYSAWVETVLGRFRSAVSVGCRPAVGGKSRTVEAYLIDFQGLDIYGSAMRIQFASRLREERDFPDLDSLKDQMTRDVEWVKANL
ncbi:MAG: bifunctional riboflavin kinase/FAD synthetase [Fimbriimonadaceae bacterium]|nr:bifunctional riboflavin kinase/FAD synthetase [Fimbriimonadaceae bacterium]QYK57475.1 MAG: bifunctional riboflavin kinase/FAD synthetase [Fimbriimonadaceae bacterium]